MNRKIIFIIVIALVVIISAYQIFIREPKPDLLLETVARGTIKQTISETGVVEAVQNIDLNFQSSGRITRIYVQAGDEVKVGQRLAQIDTTQLEIQLTEAKAALALTEARLNQLLAGATPEEIRSAEIMVSSAETALSSATQNLNNINSLTTTSLEQAYKDAFAVLRATYVQLDNTLDSVRAMQRTHFARFDQESLEIYDNQIKIENALSRVNTRLEGTNDTTRDKIDIALSEMRSALTITANSLADIHNICEKSLHCRGITSPEITAVNTNRITINAALTNVVNSQQNISSTRLTNKSNINTAEARVSVAQGELQRAQNALSIRKAGPRQVDLALYRTQIVQAMARVSFIEEQIAESLLLSPIQGTVATIHKQLGETAQVMSPAISIISANALQIKVNIYEEDITRIGLNNPVIIAPIALPNQIFEGKIATIKPTEKLVDGVVHYETTIVFIHEPPQEIKSGMTVDITIQTALRENVLIIPENALQYIGAEGKYTVQVFRNDLIQGRDVEFGLIGEDNKVEIISGLEEGEQVVIE